MRENSSALRVAAPIEQRHSPSRTSLREIGDGLAVPMRCRRGQEIYCQDGAAANWYRLVSGAARRFSVRLDGRRQIVDLLVPDDTFGFGVRGRHRFTVEAVSEGTVVASYSRARLVIEGHLIAADRAPIGRVERENDRPANSLRVRL